MPQPWLEIGNVTVLSGSWGPRICKHLVKPIPSHACRACCILANSNNQTRAISDQTWTLATHQVTTADGYNSQAPAVATPQPDSGAFLSTSLSMLVLYWPLGFFISVQSPRRPHPHHDLCHPRRNRISNMAQRSDLHHMETGLGMTGASCCFFYPQNSSSRKSHRQSIGRLHPTSRKPINVYRVTLIVPPVSFYALLPVFNWLAMHHAVARPLTWFCSVRRDMLYKLECICRFVMIQSHHTRGMHPACCNTQPRMRPGVMDN